MRQGDYGRLKASSDRTDSVLVTFRGQFGSAISQSSQQIIAPWWLAPPVAGEVFRQVLDVFFVDFNP